MSPLEVVAIDVMGSLLVLWVLNLIRRGRLYVGYGIIFIILITCSLAWFSLPGFATSGAQLLGTFISDTGRMMLAVGALVLMLVYILTQVTIVSDRLARLVQELAIDKALRVLGTENEGQKSTATEQSSEHLESSPPGKKLS